MDQSSSFSGLTEITFELVSLPKLLPVEIVCLELTELVVNGYNVTPDLHGEYMLLPRAVLRLGINHVSMHYIAKLSNDGYGCVAFTDGSANPPQQYTYTNFEPYSAHRVFPCFDQPDLKARMSLNVIMPSNWVAIANEGIHYQAEYSQTDYVLHAPEQTEKSMLSRYLLGKTGRFCIFKET